MSENPPIIVTGSTPTIDVKVGQYNYGSIVVLLSSVTKPGTTITISDADGYTNPLTRMIRISTGYGITYPGFNNPTDLSTATTKFTAISKDRFSWLNEVTFIQGATAQDGLTLQVYATYISSVIVSSYSTMTPIFVNHSTILQGAAIGFTSLNTLGNLVNLSTHLLSSGSIRTSSATASILSTAYLEAASNSFVVPITNLNFISTKQMYTQSTSLSTIRILDSYLGNTGQLTTMSNRNDGLWVNIQGTSYLYPSVEQSQFVPTSNLMQSNLSTLGIDASTMNTKFFERLEQVRWDSGISSFSTIIPPQYESISSSYRSLGPLLADGISTVCAAPGLSSLSTIFTRGISSLNAMPGLLVLSNSIKQTLSSLSVQPGICTISTTISRGLSSLVNPTSLSSFSSLIQPAFSTVAGAAGIDDLLNVLQQGYSTIAYTEGLSNLQGVIQRGLSSMSWGPGLSTLSTTISARISSLNLGLTTSSLSTVMARGMSSIAAAPGYSTLVPIVPVGLSSIAILTYQTYQTQILEEISNRTTSTGTSSILTTLRVGLSSVNAAPGVSSISSFFPISLSSMAITPGLSTLSTSISRGLSDINVTIQYPANYSTQSTIAPWADFSNLAGGAVPGYRITASPTTLLFNGGDYFTASSLRVLQIGDITTGALDVRNATLASSLVFSTTTLRSTMVAGNLSSVFINSGRVVAEWLQIQDRTLPTSSNLFASNADVFSADELKVNPIQLLFGNVPGASSLNITYTAGLSSLHQGVQISTLSTAVSLGFSSIAFPASLSSVYSTMEGKSPASYYSTISTPFGLASNLNASTVFTEQFSTGLLSTSRIATETLMVSTLRAQYLSTAFYDGPVYASFLRSADLMQPSTVSTGYLEYVLNDAVNPKSVETRALVTQTMSTGGDLVTNELRFKDAQYLAVTGSNAALFLNGTRLRIPGLYDNFSVSRAFVSTLYTSTFIVSTAASSFTIDLQGIISSGTYSTNIEQVIARPGGGPQSWGLATVGGFWNAGGLSNLHVRDIYSRATLNRPVIDSNQGADPGQYLWSTFAGSTLGLSWDGRRLIVAGSNANNTTDIVNYIAPGSYSNNYAGLATPQNPDPNSMWIKQDVTLATPFTVCRGVQKINDIYLAFGVAGASNTCIQSSSNATSYSLTTGSAFDATNANGGVHCMATNGQLLIAGGSNTGSVGNASGLAYSVDGGQTWATSGLATGAALVTNLVWSGTNFVNFTITSGGSALNYSRFGTSNWTAATTPLSFTVNTRCTGLAVTDRYVLASFYDPSFDSGTIKSLKSYDGGVTWVDAFPGHAGLLVSSLVNPTFDGQSFIASGYRNNADNLAVYVRHMSPNLSSIWFVSSQYVGITGSNVNRHTPFATKSNVVPTLALSNLQVFGDSWHQVIRSTNTIVGYANEAYGDRGQNQHLERANVLKINSLEIMSHLSSQVAIQSYTSTLGNVLNLPKATLHVANSATALTLVANKLQIRDSNALAVQLGAVSSGFDLYITRTSNIPTYFSTLAVGRGATSNEFLSTPSTNFDIYCASNSFGIFRGSRFTLSSNPASNITTFGGCVAPMVNNTGSLLNFWKTQIGGTAYYFSNAASGTTLFTGQHPTNCADVSLSTVDQHVGLLVSVADQGYTLYSPDGTQITGKDAIQMTSAAPRTKITAKDEDPNVYGVITNCFNQLFDEKPVFETYTSTIFTTNLFDRIMVNSIGEGAVWVTNANGNVANGDYLCSSAIPGYAKKQTDAKLMNYTVAKATMSCDFNPKFISSYVDGVLVSTPMYKCEDFDWNGSSFKRAFIGCTYHCA